MSEDFAKCFSENKKQMNLDGGTNTSEVGEFSIIRLDFNDGDWRVRWKVFSRAVHSKSVNLNQGKSNCYRSYCKIPDFTLPKLGIIPDFVL